MVFERFKGYFERFERLRDLPEELGNEELSFVVGLVGSLGGCSREDCDCACQNLVELVKAAFPFDKPLSLKKILVED